MTSLLFGKVMELKAFLLLASIAIAAGKPMYTGKRFIASLFPVFKTGYTDKEAGAVYIAHKQEGNCTVINSDGNVYNVLLQGNVTVTQFNLPLISELALGGYVQKRAIEVECTAYVILYILNRRQTKGGSEAFPVLPVESLSVTYMVPTVQHNALLGVVAVSDNTTVTVQLKSSRGCTYTFNGTTYKQGSQLTAVLEKRDVLQIAPPTLHPPMDCDFTGSVVQSSHPVAVFTGSAAAKIPMDSTSDSVMSQVPPVESWGTSFVVAPSTERRVIRVIAFYNRTTVHCISDFHNNMIRKDGGESYDLSGYGTGGIQYINSTRPILVLQIIGEYKKYSVSTSIVPAIDNYGVEYIIPDIQTTSMKYGRIIYINTSPNCTSNIDVDAKWTSKVSRYYQVALTTIRAPHNLTTIRSNSINCPFAVRVTGLGNEEMFGFYGSRSMLQVEALPDAVQLTCTPGAWRVTMDIHKLARAYPVAVSKNIYMSNTYCPGVLMGDVLVFNFSYNDCNTMTKKSNTSMTFSNYLTEYERDPETDLVTGEKWRYILECDLPTETDAIKFVPISPVAASGQTSGNVEEHEAVITCFSDRAYKNEIMGNPLKMDLVSNVYVQVAMKDVTDLKLLVENCYLNDNNGADNSTAVALIQNRCEANHFTHVIGHVDKLTRFYFDSSQLPRHYNTTYVTCDVSFCSLTDFSPECQSGCQKTSQ